MDNRERLAPWVKHGGTTSALCLLTLLGIFSLPAQAQLAFMERTPGHERLEFLQGEWSNEEVQTLLGQETTVRSSTRYAWLPGGVWLRGEATIWGLPGIDALRGWLLMTYDAEADEYVQLWYDNQSTLLFIKRGGWTDKTTLTLVGAHEWGGKTIHSKIVYRVSSENEFSREYLVSNDNGEGYVRRSLNRNLKRHPDGPINDGLDALEWLVGDWQAQFRPHGDDQPAPAMAFQWGDDRRSFLRMSGTQPTPDGRLVPEYENFVIWHPIKQKLTFLGVYRSAAGKIVEDGDIDLLANDSVQLNMRVHYPAGMTLPFSDGAKAGADGHTLEFRRTFHRKGENELRGVFLIKRGGIWENPHPKLKMDDGYPWRRVEPRLASSSTKAAAIGADIAATLRSPIRISSNGEKGSARRSRAISRHRTWPG